METTTEKVKPILVNMFVLYFKRGQTMQSFSFPCESLTTAIEKGKEYCTEARVRFQNVMPMAQDIDEMISIERSRNR